MNANEKNTLLHHTLFDLAAASAIAPLTVGFRAGVVILAFGFLGMPQRSTRAIERLRFFERNIDNRIDELEEVTIWRFLVEIVGLVANRVAFAALHPMIVVIQHFLKRSSIDDRLIALKTFALFPFERFDRH